MELSSIKDLQRSQSNILLFFKGKIRSIILSLHYPHYCCVSFCGSCTRKEKQKSVNPFFTVLYKIITYFTNCTVTQKNFAAYIKTIVAYKYCSFLIYVCPLPFSSTLSLLKCSIYRVVTV